MTNMYVTGALHVALALVALVSGFVVIVMRKGTLRHRRIGWVYAVSMLGLNVTALLIYRLFGRFGPFHIAALLSLLTIVAGLITSGVSRSISITISPCSSCTGWPRTTDGDSKRLHAMTAG